MNNINELKKIYLNTKIPEDLGTLGWENVRKNLDIKQGLLGFYLQRGGFVFAALLIFLTALVTSAQAAKPGDTLFPIRLLSDQIKAAVTNQPSSIVEKRAQDVIDLSKQPSSNKLDTAVKEYQNALDQSTKEVNRGSSSSSGEQLRETLNNQEQKLEEIKRQNPNSSEKLQEAINETKKAQGEVKGISVQNSQGRNHRSY